MITIQVNNESYTISENTSIAKLLEQLQIGTNGIAVAIDQQIIPNTNWDVYILQNNQNLLLIKATQGG